MKNIQLIYGDDLLDSDDLNLADNDSRALAARCEIRISSQKDLLASYVDLEEKIIIAAAFDFFVLGYYSFDVVVDRRYRRMGLGKKLIDIAMQKFYELQSDLDDFDKTTLLLHVVNPVLVPYLMREYDLVVTNEINSDTILSSE
ncbi:MAG: hypothetical protein KKC03_14115 [Bacteroidetes bacterium]|nr:hypothetical protein [Bacteroidota bacterium]